MASTGSPTAVPEGFHSETSYVVLSYLGLPPLNQPEGTCDTALEAFLSPALDCHTSSVFSPTDLGSSILKSLALLGARVTHELQAHLGPALQTLLSAPLDYELYQAVVQDVSTHTQGGWDKVLVPLVLLHALHEVNQPLAELVPMGVRYLEEAEADYVIQQGGWGSVNRLNEGDPRENAAADIDILAGEQQTQRPSPPTSLTGMTEGGEPRPWQVDSVSEPSAGAKSWLQVAVMDPDDVKSLDSNESTALGEERSENNSSISDIVHVEREELLESGAEAEEKEPAGFQAETILPEVQESEVIELSAELSSDAPSAEQTTLIKQAPSSDLAPLADPTPLSDPAGLADPTPLSGSTPLADPTGVADPTPLSGSTPLADPTGVADPTPLSGSTPLADPTGVADPTPLSGSAPLPDPTPLSGSTPLPGPTPLSDLAMSADPSPVLLEGTKSLEPLTFKQAVLSPAATISVAHVESSAPDAPVSVVRHRLVPAATAITDEPLPPAQNFPPCLVATQLEPEPEPELTVESPQPPLLSAEPQLKPAAVTPTEASAKERLVTPPEETPVQPDPQRPVSSPSSELPMLLYGGAALVAVLGVVVCGVILYKRK